MLTLKQCVLVTVVAIALCIAASGIIAQSPRPHRPQMPSPSNQIVKLLGARTISYAPRSFQGIAFSRDGNIMALQASPEYSGPNLTIWDVKRLKKITSFSVQSGWGFHQFALSPDGKAVIFATHKPPRTLVQVADTRTGKIKRTLYSYDTASASSPVRPAAGDYPAFSPNGELIVVFDSDETSVWSARSGKMLWSKEWKQEPVEILRNIDLDGDGSHYELSSVAFSPNSRLVAVEYAGAVELRDARTGALRRVFTDSGGAESPIVFSHNGTVLATAGFPPGFEWGEFSEGEDWSFRVQGVSKIWDVATGKLCSVTRDNDAPYVHSPVAFSPDDKVLLTGSIALWNTATGKKLAPQEFKESSGRPWGFKRFNADVAAVLPGRQVFVAPAAYQYKKKSLLEYWQVNWHPR